MRLTDGEISDAKRVDLRTFCERDGVTLRRESANEFSGNCPKCGGHDRLHVIHERGGDWRWFCRQCHEKWSDTPGYLTWRLGLSFPQAVIAVLDGAPTMPASAPRPVCDEKPARPFDPAYWTIARGRALTAAALAYLEGRGIDAETAARWRLFSELAISVPDTEPKRHAEAIGMPWFDQTGQVIAVRYRFLARQGDYRITSRGSFTGHAHGWHAISGWAHGGGALIVCEGEINAMSIDQASRAHGLRIDVLSLGSESQKMPAEVIDAARSYRRCVAWGDRNDNAAAWAAAIGGATPIRSPKGYDANDLLQRGLLAAFLERIIK